MLKIGLALSNLSIIGKTLTITRVQMAALTSCSRVSPIIVVVSVVLTWLQQFRRFGLQHRELVHQHQHSCCFWTVSVICKTRFQVNPVRTSPARVSSWPVSPVFPILSRQTRAKSQYLSCFSNFDFVSEVIWRPIVETDLPFENKLHQILKL